MGVGAGQPGAAYAGANAGAPGDSSPRGRADSVPFLFPGLFGTGSISGPSGADANVAGFNSVLANLLNPKAAASPEKKPEKKAATTYTRDTGNDGKARDTLKRAREAAESDGSGSGSDSEDGGGKKQNSGKIPRFSLYLPRYPAALAALAAGRVPVCSLTLDLPFFNQARYLFNLFFLAYNRGGVGWGLAESVHFCC